MESQPVPEVHPGWTVRLPVLAGAAGLLLMLPWGVSRLLVPSPPFITMLLAFSGVFVLLFACMATLMLFMTSLSSALQDLRRGRSVVGLWLLGVGALVVWEAHTGNVGFGAWKIVVGPWALGLGVGLVLGRARASRS